MDKYEEMLKRADEKYHFSELEKTKLSVCSITVTQMMCAGH